MMILEPRKVVNSALGALLFLFLLHPLSSPLAQGQLGGDCLDGTPEGECSSLKPLHCDMGILINRCDLCGCPEGQSCQGRECVAPSGPEIEAEMSVATLKKVYSPGETVQLTDPPDLPALKPSPEDSLTRAVSGTIPVIQTMSIESLPSGIYNVREGNSERTVYNINKENPQLELSQGYILEFREKPILERKAELDKEVETTKEKSEDVQKEYDGIKIEGWNIINPIAWGAKLHKGYELSALNSQLNELESELPIELQEQRERVIAEHQRFRQRLQSSSGLGITGNVVAKKMENVVSEYTNTFNGIALDISEYEAEIMKGYEEVKRVYPNLKVNITMMDSLPVINAYDAWRLLDNNSINLTGRGITIAILDTGIDYTHEDLGGCFGEGCKVVGGYDVINSDDDPIDDHLHGTHCAAIAAGNGVLKGVAPDAKLYAYKVLNKWGSGSFAQVMEGIERAVDPNGDGNFSDHVDVISMSLGATCFSYDESCGPDDPVSKSIDNAVENGVVAVISAGNSGPSEESIGSPGTARKAITVGATYKKDYDGEYWDTDPRLNQITSFSSRGPVEWENGILIKPDVVAPGAIICAARYDEVFPEGEHPYYKPCLDEEHVQLAGTSMSTPMVAGLVVLLRQKNTDWEPNEIKAAVLQTAKDIGYPPNVQGFGIIDSYEGVSLKDKPPIAEIESSGAYGGTSIDIIGVAKGDAFVSYSLYFREEPKFFTPSNWSLIHYSTEEVVDGILYTWDISELDETRYSLKLVVETESQTSVALSMIRIENTKISYPEDFQELFWLSEQKMIFNSDERIDINGTAAGKDFEGYHIEWCSMDYDCSTDGVTLVGGGDFPVINAKLAHWDVPEYVKSGYYNLILKNVYQGYEHRHQVKIYVETELQKGWPKKIEIVGGGMMAYSFMRQPTLADIDDDGKNDIVVAYGDYVIAYDHEGNYLEGFPSEIDGALAQQGPAVADIDKDGHMEIVVGDNWGLLHVLDHKGSYESGWPRYYSGYINLVTIEDLDGDGELEILFGDWSRYMHVIDKDGNHLDGWPKRLDSALGYNYFTYIPDPVSVADLDGDGVKEIIVNVFGCNKTGSCGGGQPVSSMSLSVLDIHGNLLQGWPRNFTRSMSSSMPIADIDDDGHPDILFTQGFKLHALDYQGNELEGFPIEIDGLRLYSVMVGDLENDGVLDIALSAVTDFYDDRPYRDCLYIIDKNGSVKDGYPFCSGDYIGDYRVSFYFQESEHQSGNLYGSVNQVAVADDGYVSGNLPGFYVFNPDGTVPENMPKAMDEMILGHDSTPIGDLDNDNDNEVMAYTWSGNLFVWDLGGSPDNHEWPVYHHDSQHTGRYISKPPASCGNDVREGPEKCDGSDDQECPGQCQPDCTCPPLPKSMINNTGLWGISGYLLMKVQRHEGTNWVDEVVVVDDLASGSPRSIPAGTHLALDTIWRDEGAYTTTRTGAFRVYAALLDSEGEIITTSHGQGLEAVWEFSVV